MQITAETTSRARLAPARQAQTKPADVVPWHAAADDRHTTTAMVVLRVGGAFSSRMESKDGGMDIDCAGTYNEVKSQRLLVPA